MTMKTDQHAWDLGKYNHCRRQKLTSVEVNKNGKVFRKMNNVGHERHKDDNEFLKSQWKKNSKENEYQRTQTKREKKKDHHLLTLTNVEVWKVVTKKCKRELIRRAKWQRGWTSISGNYI